MAVFIVLWPSLLTTKLKSVIRHNLGHSIVHIHANKSEKMELSQRPLTEIQKLFLI